MNSQSLYTITQVLIAFFLIALSFSACLFVFKFFFFNDKLKANCHKTLNKNSGLREEHSLF